MVVTSVNLFVVLLWFISLVHFFSFFFLFFFIFVKFIVKMDKKFYDGKYFEVLSCEEDRLQVR